MKYFAATAALVSVVPGIVSLTINTPMSVVQCQPQMLSWTDGQPPYYLSIIPGGQPSAAPLKTFDTQTGNSMTWNVDIPAGTSITCALKDATGATAYTDMVTIRPGTDSSCSSGGGGSSPTSAAPASTVDTSNSGGISGNTGGSTTGGSSVVAPAQAADAGTASAVASSGSGTSRAASAAVGTSSAARGSTSTLGVVAGTQSRAVASSSVATASASRAATTNTSGADSRFTASGFGLAGFVALVGAMFL